MCLIYSYDDDEIGSKMTTNFICINNKLTIKEAMKELVAQAEEKKVPGRLKKRTGAAKPASVQDGDRTFWMHVRHQPD